MYPTIHDPLDNQWIGGYGWIGHMSLFYFHPSIHSQFIQPSASVSLKDPIQFNPYCLPWINIKFHPLYISRNPLQSSPFSSLFDYTHPSNPLTLMPPLNPLSNGLDWIKKSVDSWIGFSPLEKSWIMCKTSTPQQSCHEALFSKCRFGCFFWLCLSHLTTQVNSESRT